MAKVGYIFKAAGYDGFDTDVEWMKQYGCVQVIEEENGHEKLRPQWKQLMASMERGDEIVLTKFSNALRGSRELAAFIEFCRVKVVRIISIHDKVGVNLPSSPLTVSRQMRPFSRISTGALQKRKPTPSSLA